jgi:hypothetical protein
MAIARLTAVVFVACAFSFACGTSPCGLKLQHLFLPRPATVGDQPQQRDVEMPCCGASVFQDIDLRNVGDVEIDLSNPNGNGVDGFVTSAACDKLFSGPYTGVATSPTCQVYIGPVPPRAVSERQENRAWSIPFVRPGIHKQRRTLVRFTRPRCLEQRVQVEPHRALTR